MVWEKCLIKYVFQITGRSWIQPIRVFKRVCIKDRVKILYLGSQNMKQNKFHLSGIRNIHFTKKFVTQLVPNNVFMETFKVQISHSPNVETIELSNIYKYTHTFQLFWIPKIIHDWFYNKFCCNFSLNIQNQIVY